MTDRAAFLRNVPVLRGLSQAALEQVASRLRVVEVPAGEWIMRRGEIGEHMFIVSSGRVEVVDEGPPEVLVPRSNRPSATSIGSCSGPDTTPMTPGPASAFVRPICSSRSAARVGQRPSGHSEPTACGGASCSFWGRPRLAISSRRRSLDRFRSSRTSHDCRWRIEALGRRLAGRSVRVVLSGGGARAFAHVGVLEELRDAGIRFDRIAGVSLGSLVAAAAAAGYSPEQIHDELEQYMVKSNPTIDFVPPVYSLIRGAKTRRMVHERLDGLRIEELELRISSALAAICWPASRWFTGPAR